MSQPSTRSASPAAMRTAWMSAGVLAMRMCVVTAPPFCASPVWSSTVEPRPSRCPAMPSSAPMVTTPVPPTPVIRMFQGCDRSVRSGGAGRFASFSLRRDLLALAHAAAMHGHEARAEAIHAAVVLVAVALVDLALAPELGFLRQHRHAERLLPAIAAAFAHQRVHHHPLLRIDDLAALAAAALLGGADLVEDQHATRPSLRAGASAPRRVPCGRRTRRRTGRSKDRSTCRCRR